MLNAKAFANAAATITAVFYIGCALLSYFAPDLVFGFAESWMHTINLRTVKANIDLNLGSLAYGLVTIVGLTWVTTYAMIALYNRWAK